MMLTTMSRPLLLLGLCLVVAFFTVRQFNLREAYLHTFASATKEPVESVSEISLSADRPLKFVFTELQAAHDEVMAPLIQAFASLPGANVTGLFFAHLDRFGAFDLYNSLDIPMTLPTPRSSKEIFPFVYENTPDFIVAVSCGYDDFDKYKTLLENTDVHIFCIVHHSDKWDNWMFQFYEKRITPWVRAGRLDFVTLSQHVTDSLADGLIAWKAVKWESHYPPVRTFPPIFTVQHPTGASDAINHFDFALQGNYQSKRRNFTRVFEELSEAKDQIAAGKDGLNKDLTITLHLVGSGSAKPTVPEHIKDMVVFQENLNYSDFYNVLAKMTAILPAFADDDYFVHKASSSVPASIIAGSPLVATHRMLDSYSYVDQSGVWFQKDGQSDFDALKDILKQPLDERERKMAAAKRASKQVVDMNKRNVAVWVEKALTLRQQRAVIMVE